MFRNSKFIYKLLFSLAWVMLASWQGQAIVQANSAESSTFLDGEVEATQPTVQIGESVGFTIRVHNNSDADIEGVVLHVGLPDSVRFVNRTGWALRLDGGRYVHLKPLGTVAANTTQDLVLMLLVKDDIDDDITRIPTPSLQITAGDLEPFELGMGAGGNDVIIIDEVAAFDDSMQTPTGLPDDSEPTRSVQEVRVFLPLIF